MIDLRICRPSQSNWASPLHLVRKKDGSWIPCGNYRKLNSITVPDRYPVPNIQDFNSLLHRKQVFSKINIVRAFNQIPVEEKDIPKTAVITPFGLFEFLVLPFGLRNAAQTFQRFIHNVLQDIPFVFTYIDDILIASNTPEQHKYHLQVLFQRLEKYGICINLFKCVFAQDKIPFLGYIVSQQEIAPTPERVDTIIKYPRPDTTQSLRRILGMINFYCRALPHSPAKQTLLFDLIKNTPKDNCLIWTTEANFAFEQLKSDVANATLLAHPAPDLPMVLMVDASDTCIGASLNQIALDKSFRPLAFYSKKLSPAQCKYSTYDRAMLSVYAAIKHFRFLLEGNSFILYTDHKPLTYAFSQNPNKASPR